MFYLFITRLMCRREETNRVTNDMETSPIIPDSFKNNLTTSTTNTVNPKSNLIFNDMKVSTDSNIKHEITTKHSSKSSTNVSHFYHQIFSGTLFDLKFTITCPIIIVIIYMSE